MDKIERDETIEKLVRKEVDRWDMDTLMDYAIERLFENMVETDDGELAKAWNTLFGKDEPNPFGAVGPDQDHGRRGES